VPPAVAVAGNDNSPAQAVQLFYALVNSHQFGEAAQLWTVSMQQEYPPSSALNDRFSDTRQISLVGDRVLAQRGNGAIVGVDVLEMKDSGETVQWIGTWTVVRERGQWLLNWPHLHQA
jgi:hypothetical protein